MTRRSVVKGATGCRRASWQYASALLATIVTGCATGGPFRGHPAGESVVRMQSDVLTISAPPSAPHREPSLWENAAPPPPKPRERKPFPLGTATAPEVVQVKSLRDPEVKSTATTEESVARAMTELAPAIPAPAAFYPIDLPAALRLAESINPVIGEARARIEETIGRQRQAQAILLPSFHAGGNYHDHTGNLQRSSGQILSVSSQVLYFGGGAGPAASGTVGDPASGGQSAAASIPTVLIAAPLTDALFEPLAARQQVAATGFDAMATSNDVLLGVATDFLTLQGSIARLRARERTAVEAAEVVRITGAYARTGQGRQADADRATTEWKLRRAGIREAEGEAVVSSARLVRRLHLDPTLRINPDGDPLALFNLVDPDRPLEELIETAVRRRPEILARSADVVRAEYRLKQEWYRPYLPTVWLGAGGGAFGGGSNLAPPTMGMFRGRTDFDAVAFWTVRNFGLGELTARRRRKAEIGEAAATRSRTMNTVREEVASARADILAKREQISISLGEITTARDGFMKDLQRIQGAAGRPLDVLNNLRYLGQAREALIAAVVGYNEAQFRLFVAMGAPPPLEGPTGPAPPVDDGPTLVGPPVAALENENTDHAIRAGTTRTKPVAGVRSIPAEPVRAAMETLAKARQGEVAAMSDYERIQQTLLESLANKGAVDREALLKNLHDLAEAHRGEIGARVAYDRAFWSVFSTLGDPSTATATTDPEVRPSKAEEAAPPPPPVPPTSLAP